MDDISYLVDCVHNILDVLNRVQGGHDGDFQLLVCKVDFLQRMLVNLDIDDVIIETIGRAHSLLVEIERNENSSGGYSASVQHDSRRGRPSYLISKEQLSYLIEQGFKLQEVATMLGISCIPLFMINHGSDILHVFFFISSDYSITAVKSPPFPVVCIGPWIKECAFNNYYCTDE